MKKVGKKELLNLILEEVISLDEAEKKDKSKKRQITDEEFNKLITAGFNYKDFENAFLRLLNNQPDITSAKNKFKTIEKYILGNNELNDPFIQVITGLLDNLPVEFSDDQRLQIYKKFYKDQDPTSKPAKQKSAPIPTQAGSKVNDVGDREIDNKFEDALDIYDQKRAAARKELQKNNATADQLRAFDQKTKTVKNSFLKAFKKKYPIKTDNDNEYSLDDKKTPSLSEFKQIVLSAFPGIDKDKNRALFVFLSELTEEISKAFENIPKQTSSNTEELSESYSGSNVQKIFRSIISSEVNIKDAGKFYTEFVTALMEPIVNAGSQYVQSTMKKDDDLVSYGKNVSEKSKQIFLAAQEKVKESMRGELFNYTIGNAKRYARKIGVEKFKQGLKKIGEEIVKKIEFNKLFFDEEKRDSLIRKLGNLFKAGPTLATEGPIPTSLDSPVDPVDKLERESEIIFKRGPSREMVIRFLKNEYNLNVNEAKIEEILKEIENVGGPIRPDEFQKIFKEMGIPLREKEPNEKPYYFVDEERLMERFSKFIIQQNKDLSTDETSTNTQDTEISEAKSKLSPSFKTFVQLYKNEEMFLDTLKDEGGFDPFEIETIIWYLSDKKRFANFMNTYLKNDPLYQKAIKLKSSIFKRLFNNIEHLQFDAEGEIFGFVPEEDKPFFNFPSLGDNNPLEEVLKPAIQSIIKEMLEK